MPKGKPPTPAQVALGNAIRTAREQQLPRAEVHPLTAYGLSHYGTTSRKSGTARSGTR